MGNTIPVVYDVIIKRFYQRSMFGRLKTYDARMILCKIYHFPKKKVSRILNEMHQMGLIRLRNCAFVEILWKPKQ